MHLVLLKTGYNGCTPATLLSRKATDLVSFMLPCPLADGGVLRGATSVSVVVLVSSPTVVPAFEAVSLERRDKHGDQASLGAFSGKVHWGSMVLSILWVPGGMDAGTVTHESRGEVKRRKALLELRSRPPPPPRNELAMDASWVN